MFYPRAKPCLCTLAATWHIGVLAWVILEISCAEASATEPPTLISALNRLQYLQPAHTLPAVAHPSGLAQHWIAPCGRDVLFLSGVTKDITADLENLTAADQPIHVRHRGMHALIMRGSESGIRLAADKLLSGNPVERASVWQALQCCPRTLEEICKTIPPIAMLEAYRLENSPDVYQEIERFFAVHKAAFAVDAICRNLEDKNLDFMGHRGTHALAEIGDSSAVRQLIAARTDPEAIVWALGRIADSGGIDYIESHLHLPGAPIALAHIGGDRSLSILRQGLIDLQKGIIHDDMKNISGYTQEQANRLSMAIMLLSSDTPRDHLLDIAQNTDDEFLRRLAIEELGRLGIQPVFDKFIELHRSIMHSRSSMYCIDLLKNDDSEKSLESLKDNYKYVIKKMAKDGQAIHNESTMSGKDLAIAEYELFSAIHSRIGNDAFFILKKCTD